MTQRRILKLIHRVRRDIEEVALELENPPDSTDVLGVDDDLLEVRARVDALELRVFAIEGRAEQ